MKKHNIFLIISLIIILIGTVQTISYSDNKKEMDYIEYGSENKEVIIMIHGSPGSKNDFNLLAPSLENKYHVYALDMPCFGNSPMAEDCGIDPAAKKLNYFMLERNITKANILGYSWGGGVAIEFAYFYPEKVENLILLSNMGIQEGEFIPNHNLEKLYSIVAYPFVVFYPGSFAGNINWRDGFMKSFIDTDLRPIREHLQSINAPTLILYGNKDTNVEPWVAQEHARLIKNSELVSFNGTHIALFSNVSEIAPAIKSFLARHQQSTAQAELNLIIESRGELR